MRVVKMENKRRKKGRTGEGDPGKEDDWDHELRVRRELAEKAIEYGIQQRKYRMQHPELWSEDMSILQRIKHDAEEILRRRRELAEAQRRSHSSQEKSSFKLETFNEEEDEAEEEESEEEEVSMREKKRTEKAVRNLLNLGKGSKKGGSSQRQKLPESSPQQSLTDSTLGHDGRDNVLRFKQMMKNKGGKGRRKKGKKRNRDSNRSKEVYYRNIGLPAFKGPKT